MDEDEVVAWALSPVWFLLGCVLGVLVLVCRPSLYERLRQVMTSVKRLCTKPCDPACFKRLCDPACCTRGVSDMDNPVYNQGNQQVSGKPETAINHNYDYMDIDMNKTQTFKPAAKPTQKQRYEQCEINRNSHTYSKCSGDQQPEVEDEPNRKSEPHTYVILEPGSNKRQEIRMLTEEPKDDPNHIYFRLEPGTNKLFPQPRVCVEDISDHTYFVLEAPAAANIDEGNEENAYAVNDLSGHNYFILEKE